MFRLWRKLLDKTIITSIMQSKLNEYIGITRDWWGHLKTKKEITNWAMIFASFFLCTKRMTDIFHFRLCGIQCMPSVKNEDSLLVKNKKQSITSASYEYSVRSVRIITGALSTDHFKWVLTIRLTINRIIRLAASGYNKRRGNAKRNWLLSIQLVVAKRANKATI